MTWRLAVAGVTALPLLVGCAGQPCDDLPRLRAERDAAREEYAVLIADGTTPPEVTASADDALHALERRVYDVEQECEGR